METRPGFVGRMAALLLNSALGQKMLAEQAEVELSRRRTLASQLAELEKDRESRGQPLRDALARAREASREAWRNYQRATLIERDAYNELRNDDLRYRARIEALRLELEELADPRIAALGTKIQNATPVLLGRWRQWGTAATNIAAESLRAAAVQVLELRYKAVSEGDIPAALDAACAGLTEPARDALNSARESLLVPTYGMDN